MRAKWTIAGTALLAAACSTVKKDGVTADTAPAAGAAAAATPAPGSAADVDRATSGGGVPAGYVGRTDREGVAISGAHYTTNGGRWEVTTGPAHVVYAPRDSARGTYTASATVDQLEAPRHPEAYGMFVGGRNLDQPTQQYTYFLVRGTGEYLVKVRDGATTKSVVDWTPSAAVPKADASGKASYRLAVQVGADSVRFLVDDKPVATVARAAVPTDGVAGLRINHNLHVAVTPVEIKK